MTIIFDFEKKAYARQRKNIYSPFCMNVLEQNNTRKSAIAYETLNNTRFLLPQFKSNRWKIECRTAIEVYLNDLGSSRTPNTCVKVTDKLTDFIAIDEWFWQTNVDFSLIHCFWKLFFEFYTIYVIFIYFTIIITSHTKLDVWQNKTW